MEYLKRKLHQFWTTKNEKSRRMRLMLIIVGILFGAIFLYKIIMSLFLSFILSRQSHVATVSEMKVSYSDWQPKVLASGSLRAIRGVNVTSEVAGLVQNIYFTPGSEVTEDTVLVQLNAENDIALLHSLEAQADLAKVTYVRDQAQFTALAVSKQTLDTDAANLKNLRAQVAQQEAFVRKKTIRAPFSGRLGINLVNPGQYINPGDAIVMLQTLDPIYADFYIPQQQLAQLSVGQDVFIKTDAYPKKIFKGKITTINPGIDTTTRNVEVEATVANPTFELAPGMFGSVEINVGSPERFLTLPQTAISFNPYGSIVYVLRKGEGKSKHAPLIAKQAFVITGETRGEQIQILKGLKEGDSVVTSGQLKLKNGAEVAINNSVAPSNNPNPNLPEEH